LTAVADIAHYFVDTVGSVHIGTELPARHRALVVHSVVVEAEVMVDLLLVWRILRSWEVVLVVSTSSMTAALVEVATCKTSLAWTRNRRPGRSDVGFHVKVDIELCESVGDRRVVSNPRQLYWI
jgi:hypothetical protein